MFFFSLQSLQGGLLCRYTEKQFWVLRSYVRRNYLNFTQKRPRYQNETYLPESNRCIERKNAHLFSFGEKSLRSYLGEIKNEPVESGTLICTRAEQQDPATPRSLISSIEATIFFGSRSGKEREREKWEFLARNLFPPCPLDNSAQEPQKSAFCLSSLQWDGG